jgi:hypothetical protein
MKAKNYVTVVNLSVLLKILMQANLPVQAQSILNDMEQSTALRPTRVHYNILLAYWAKSKAHDANDRIQALLLTMVRLGSNDRQDLLPDRISYDSAICSMLESSTNDGIERAIAILKSCTHSDHDFAKPDTGTYLTLMRGLVRRIARESEGQMKESICLHLEPIVVDMYERSLQSALITKPIVDTYNLCLFAWSQSHSSLASSKALALFEMMEQKGVKPDGRSYQLLLKCLCIKPTKALEQVIQDVLQKIQQDENVEQTVDLLNLNLGALCESGAPHQAEQVLNQQTLESDATEPDESSYLTLIQGYAKVGKVHDAQRVLGVMNGKFSSLSSRITYGAYASTMEAWGLSKQPEAMERVGELFDELKQKEKPTSYVYGAYQRALSRSNLPDAPHRIEELLKNMQEDFESGKNDLCRPDARNFSIAISCWAHSKLDCAAERAQAILWRLEELYFKGGQHYRMKPNAVCYKSAIQAWARTSRLLHSGDRAIAILDRMEASHESDKSFPRPNCPCYNYTLVAIGRSVDPDKGNKIFSTLRRMEESHRGGNHHARPTSETYRTAIRAIGTTNGSDEHRGKVFALTSAIMDNYLQSSNHVDLDVFGEFLWASSRLLPGGESRDRIVSDCIVGKWPESLIRSREMADMLGRVVSLAAHADIISRLATPAGAQAQ